MKMSLLCLPCCLKNQKDIEEENEKNQGNLHMKNFKNSFNPLNTTETCKTVKNSYLGETNFLMRLFKVRSWALMLLFHMFSFRYTRGFYFFPIIRFLTFFEKVNVFI